MQKRKFKINILDITIVILIICAVFALAFRETISEFFSKPEIKVLEVNVTAQVSEPAQKSVLIVGNTVVLENDMALQGVVKSVGIQGDSVTAVISCNGYKRFGRYYTEKGDNISAGSEISLFFNKTTVNVSVEKVEIPV